MAKLDMAAWATAAMAAACGANPSESAPASLFRSSIDVQNVRGAGRIAEETGAVDDDDHELGQRVYSTTIGSDGGVAQGPKGFRAEIPAGALGTDTVITVAREHTPLFVPGAQVVHRYRLGPDGTQFAGPVSLTLPQGRAGSGAFAFTVPEQSSNVQTLASTGTGASGPSATVHAWTTHFSDVGVLQLDPALIDAFGADIGPLFQSGADALAAQYVDSHYPEPPPSPDTCPCAPLLVVPRQIPISDARPFQPGQDLQLVVLCEGEDVHDSGGAAASWSTAVGSSPEFSFDLNLHSTAYSLTDPASDQIVGVDADGHVTAVGPGNTVVEIVTRMVNIGTAIHLGPSGVSADPEPPTFCTASGAVPVTVTCPSGLVACNHQCVDNACQDGQIFDTGSCACITAPLCTADWTLVPRNALTIGPNGSGGNGLLANYSDGTVVFGEGPIWFGPHASGDVPSWYPADRLADGTAPALWQTIWGIGGETLTGYVMGPRTGTVEFSVGCDDYCSIDIPGIVSGVEDSYSGGGTGGAAQLQGGVWYPITLAYQNRWGSNGFNFYYRCQ